jgi:hypothetical protein
LERGKLKVTKLKGNVAREKISMTLDGQLCSVLRSIKEVSGLNMSATVEGLLLDALKQKSNGKAEGIKCQ